MMTLLHIYRWPQTPGRNRLVFFLFHNSTPSLAVPNSSFNMREGVGGGGGGGLEDLVNVQ